MTNREWLNGLSDEEFVDWCLDYSFYIENHKDKVCPKLNDLKFQSTSTKDFLKKWLKQERVEDC